ncbi:hypothetical protein [Vibrio cholerae]|uniref:hypothetical protein n=1 Tax=Vibrio cholerae TaxID=666 RepID=UPI00105A68A9|nr:hypothetical protein [Vibrio cholerae]TDK79751.1 hypothetical protein E2O02_17010 [Vibrio cholerae]UZC89468.1 hypothetical protein OFY13_12035 [Vibrio cholerae]HDV5508862.1 hypothetical protein [Vibrio cholerae]
MKKLIGWFCLLVTLFFAYKVTGIGGVILLIIPIIISISISVFYSSKCNHQISDDLSSSENYEIDHANDTEPPIPDVSRTGEDWRGLPY